MADLIGNASVHDVVLNSKETNDSPMQVILPFTRQENIIGGFCVIDYSDTDKLNTTGPLFLLANDTVSVSDTNIRKLLKIKKTT